MKSTYVSDFLLLLSTLGPVATVIGLWSMIEELRKKIRFPESERKYYYRYYTYSMWITMIGSISWWIGQLLYRMLGYGFFK